MRDAPPELIDFLNSNNSFLMADCYDFVLVGGYTASYTTADFDIAYKGVTYRSGELILERDRMRIVCGTEVDNLNIKLSAKPTSLLNGSSWLAAIRNGGLDGARITVQRVFMPSWGDVNTVGGIVLFSGLVADIPTVGRLSAEININSDLQYLNIKVPRDLYQAGCKNVLYGYGCGLVKENFAIASTVVSSTLSQVAVDSKVGDGYFDIGAIYFVSGPNAGIQHSIKQWAGGVAYLALPLLTPCNPADAVKLYPGCDKARATCINKFNNLVRFRGEPFIPVPEAIV